jgi:DNA mismatch repair protein MLH3
MQLRQGDELRDLIKGFLAKLETDGSAYSLPSEEPPTESESLDRSDTFFWLKALRWCPRELLDLVNSKACRSGCITSSRNSEVLD